MKFYSSAFPKIGMTCLGSLLWCVSIAMANSYVPGYGICKHQKYEFFEENMRHVIPILHSEKSNSFNFNFGNVNGKVNTNTNSSSIVSYSTNLDWQYNKYLDSNFIGHNINSVNRSFYFSNKLHLLNGQLQFKQNTDFGETTGFQESSIVQWNYNFLNLYSKFLYSEQNKGEILYLTGRLPLHMKLNYCMYDWLGLEPEWFSQIMYNENNKFFMAYGFNSTYEWFLKYGTIFNCLNRKYGIIDTYDSENKLLHVAFAMNPDFSEADLNLFAIDEFKDFGLLEHDDWPGYQNLTQDGLSVDFTRHDQVMKLGASWHFHFGRAEFLQKRFGCSFWVGEGYEFGLKRNVASAGVSLRNDDCAVDLGADNQKNLSIDFSANL